MQRDLSLKQIAEGLPKSVLNASDKDLEGFQEILDQTIKVREAHKDLQRMVQSFSGPKKPAPAATMEQSS
ncbi:hypothetical protein SAMN05192534_14017 [Alteribacillus persepolensis]|uniref:Uncharacterized protein n=1 Tax=Alteribacillus persepolensis TaxID=568899 RepID=A0A1G8K2Q6_9BACI|nr:hypothetical protein [Alteribacillus persepolensis]SDI37711.1 hypothetical protein SAMN05192534_14017 [Alteribacillus persepolensis]